MPKDERKRYRVKPEDVRNNAASGGRRSGNFFNLPKGVREIPFPEKACTVDMDFLAYEVTAENHPDKAHNVRPGALWYKYPFVVFRQVGINQESIVSPASVSLPCPLMERRRELAEDYKANEEAIKAMGMQKWTAFTVRDPDDEDKAAVFACSAGKFWASDAGLENELKQTEEENLFFYDYKDGKTLRVRFSQLEFATDKGKGEYLGCTKIEFKDREPLDEEEWLGKVPCLDTIFNILPYDTIKAMMVGADAGNGDGGDAPQATGSGSSGGTATARRKAKPEPQEAPSEAPSGGEKPDIEVGDIVKGKTFKGVKFKEGTVSSVDGDDLTVDIDGEEHDADMEDVVLVKKAEAEEVNDKASEKTATKASSAKGGKRIPKVGDRIVDDQGIEGEVIKVDEAKEDATVKRKGDKTGILDFDEIKKYLNEEESDEDEGAWEPAVGDKVAWDNGTETGVIAKIKGEDAKVTNDDGSGNEMVPLKDLKKK